MNRKISRIGGTRGAEKLLMLSLAFLLLIFPMLSGCKKSSAPPKTAVKKSAEPAKTDQAEVAVQETAKNDQGYIYDRRDRRDPFVPLIESTKKAANKDEKRIMGTLASYDIGDFKVLAIANKGARRYALLLAPGNRSFTVYEGTVLGFNNGKVEKITDNQVIIIEHVENYLGKIESRQLILELHKGR